MVNFPNAMNVNFLKIAYMCLSSFTNNGDDGQIDTIVANKIIGKNGSSKIQTDQGKRNIETRLINAKIKKRELLKIKKNVEKNIDTFREQISKAEADINTHRQLDEKLVQDYKELEREKNKLENQLSNLTDKLMVRMRNPVNFSGVPELLIKLSDQMVKVKLPKTQSMEFFDELSECEECICGRPIGAAEKDAIKARSKNYLSEDNIGELNAIKTDIRNISNCEKIEEIITQIRQTNRNRMLNLRELQKLDKQTPDREIIEQLQNKIYNLRLQEQDALKTFKKLTEERKEEQEVQGLTWEDNIELCNQYIEYLENKLAEASNTLTFKNKALLLKQILKEINERSLITLKLSILNKTNERIAKFLERDDISIARIDTFLHLSDRANVSVGQQLSIAYAFLSTLFYEAPHRLPFIVDTPAAPLDLGVRREVSKILPELFEQLIVFITSGERNGFADTFYLKNADCLFLTITKEYGKMTVIKDVTYFKNYQENRD